MRKFLSFLSAALCTLAFSAACTVHQTEAPSVTGPSELALSIVPTAVPDSLSQDGSSQSAISVFARDANAKPIAGLALRLDMSVGGVLQDFGTLAARTIVTGADGKASTVYTAPPPPPPGVGGSGTFVRVVVTVIGNNAQVTLPPAGPAAVPLSVDIHLMPPGVILPPAGTPTAAFTITPSPVLLNVASSFDASTSTPGTGATQITSYQWNFGDGATATGKTATHTFTTTGTFNVTLTVTNDRTLSASTVQAVSVGATTAPTATFVVSVTGPVVGQTVFFNGDGSRAAAGHSIAAWTWDFGDGTFVHDPINTSHVYSQAGSYTVLLTVADETGQRGTFTTVITVGSGNPIPSFTVNPGAPPVGVDVTFDSSGTQAFGSGVKIASWAWTFGDGTTSTLGPVTTHKYTVGGGVVTSRTVTLTVTDSLGRTGSTAQVISVGP
jgi:PKD repeat protein